MQVKTDAIVISTIKYGEADLIVRLYTQQAGINSYLLRGIRKSRKGKIRVSHFQPLTLLTIDATHKGKDSLDYIKEVQVTVPYNSIHTDIFKSSIALFLADCFTQIFKESQQDDRLFSYLKNALIDFDAAASYNNIHLKILLDITSYLGFGPDSTSIEASYFNLNDGTFDDNGLLPQHATLDESHALKSLIGTNFDTIGEISLSRKQRESILNLILRYYEIHLHGFKKPTSLEVLTKLYS